MSNIPFRKNRNAAIKIVVAEKSTELSHELRVLQHLDKSPHDHPGRRHVLHLLDHFYHDGPNGRHLCVVLDVLGPKITTVIERSKQNRIDGQLARHVSRQLLLAITYLHSSGVAHGGTYDISLHSATPTEMCGRYSFGQHFISFARVGNHGPTED